MAQSRKRKLDLGKLGIFTYDTNLIVAIIFLTAFGLIMIYSASYYEASMNSKYQNDAAYFLKNQLQWSLVGLAFMLVVANVNYHTWRYFALIGFVGAVILVLLLLTGLGEEVNGAVRWLKIPGVGMFQVAEPIKLAMIIFSAALITGRASEIRASRFVQSLKGMAWVLIPAVFMFVLIWKISDNMSTAIIILGIVCIMVFLVHPKYWPFLLVIAVGIAAVLGYLYFLQNSPESAGEGFRSDRILAWLNPYGVSPSGTEYETDTAYQALQALYAIGSGGLFGKGLGNSIQKLGRIPEAYNDMIFAIVCEELGVFGAGLVILLFIYLLYRIYSITQRADDLFGRMLCIGVFGHVALQVILNLMVVTSLFPTTGVTLPFFSAGGTATVFLFVEFGIVLNVEKVSRKKREQEIARMEERMLKAEQGRGAEHEKRRNKNHKNR